MYDAADVIAFRDNTSVKAGATSYNLNEQVVAALPDASVNAGDPINITKPVMIVSEGTGDALAPVSFAGTEFVYFISRGTSNFTVFSPFGTANVQLCYGSGFTSCFTNITVPKGGIGSFGDVANGVTVRILSNVSVLVYHGAGGSEPLF